MAKAEGETIVEAESAGIKGTAHVTVSSNNSRQLHTINLTTRCQMLPLYGPGAILQ
jgi:hypothetical protein